MDTGQSTLDTKYSLKKKLPTQLLGTPLGNTLRTWETNWEHGGNTSATVNKSYILIVCLWRDNSAFSFYGRTGLWVVVTFVCDGARVHHRRPTGLVPALPDSRIFTDRARRGGCRAGSVTEGRPGLKWYLFTSTIRIRPNFNITVKIVFLSTPQCFSLEARFPNER